jgi:NAD+ synthetase
MRVTNPASAALGDQLLTMLATLRADRRFDAPRWLAAKLGLLNHYYRQYHLSAAVVAVSGGLDSALVLALVAAAARQPNSPITRIVPVLMPVFSPGATGQTAATERGQQLCDQLDLKPVVLDLTPAQHALKQVVDQGLDHIGGDWADGQLVAYTRTPALYYTTSVLTEAGEPAAICGTTNRDEGGYLGYIGKASDAMVDLQLIADLHKSEVRAVAGLLQVPTTILATIPTGDMFDGRPDEAVFGTSYDFVELFLLDRCSSATRRQELRADWSSATAEEFAQLAARLEKLHHYNAHKYLGSSPAVHLNVIEAAVPGGWDHPITALATVDTTPDLMLDLFNTPLGQT